jgi:hypothetical protein
VTSQSFLIPPTGGTEQEGQFKIYLDKSASSDTPWTKPIAMPMPQRQCAVKEFGPQRIVPFQLIASGMGSSLHTLNLDESTLPCFRTKQGPHNG